MTSTCRNLGVGNSVIPSSRGGRLHCPSLLLPQATAVPSLRRSTVWSMPAETIRIDRLGQPVAGFPKVIRSFDFTVQGYCNSYGNGFKSGSWLKLDNLEVHKMKHVVPSLLDLEIHIYIYNCIYINDVIHKIFWLTKPLERSLRFTTSANASAGDMLCTCTPHNLWSWEISVRMDIPQNGGFQKCAYPNHWMVYFMEHQFINWC